MREKYFSRSATWQMLDGRLVVHDSFSTQAPRMLTMEPWYEIAFMAADCLHTVQQFIEAMGKEYQGGAPDGLSEQVIDILRTLIEEEIIKLHDYPKELPRYFACDYFELSPKEKEELMRIDGLIK